MNSDLIKHKIINLVHHLRPFTKIIISSFSRKNKVKTYFKKHCFNNFCLAIRFLNNAVCHSRDLILKNLQQTHFSYQHNLE
jgi:hypothetical protein